MGPYDLSFRARAVGEILHSATWRFDSSGPMLKFLGSIQKHYGPDILQEIRKIVYTIDFLDADSIEGAEELAKIIVSPSTYQLEMQAFEAAAKKALAADTPGNIKKERNSTTNSSHHFPALRLANVESLHIDFKVDRDWNQSDLYADVNPKNVKLLGLIDRISSIRVRDPKVTGLSNLKRTRRIERGMALATYHRFAAFDNDEGSFGIAGLWT